VYYGSGISILSRFNISFI